MSDIIVTVDEQLRKSGRRKERPPVYGSDIVSARISAITIILTRKVDVCGSKYVDARKITIIGLLPATMQGGSVGPSGRYTRPAVAVVLYMQTVLSSAPSSDDVLLA